VRGLSHRSYSYSRAGFSHGDTCLKCADALCDVYDGYGWQQHTRSNIINACPQVCAESLRARQPAITWSAAAAHSHAKDVTALRENLISCAKGRTFSLSDSFVLLPVTRWSDATLAWLTQSTNAKAGSHTLVIDGEPFKLCKRLLLMLMLIPLVVVVVVVVLLHVL
jgi:hypothetical protein